MKKTSQVKCLIQALLLFPFTQTKTIILPLSLCFLFYATKAQLPETKFQTFRMGDELINSGGYFFDAAEDEYGFVWLAPRWGPGIIRYDGYDMHYFMLNKNPRYSLSTHVFFTVNSFWDGKIYIASGGDLNVYDIEMDSTYNYQPTRDKMRQESSHWIEPVAKDVAGNIWIGSFNGFRKLDLEINKFEWLYANGGPDDETQSFRPNYHIDLLFDRDSTHILWRGTSSGLYQYNVKTTTSVEFRPPDLEANGTHVYVLGMYQDKAGWLWIGTRNEDGHLYAVHPVSKEWKIFDIKSIKNGQTIDHGPIYRVMYHSDTHLWLTTEEGVGLVDKNTGTFEAYFNQPQDTASIINGGFYRGGLVDRHGVLWVLGKQGFSRSDQSVGPKYELPTPPKVVLTEIKVNQQPYIIPRSWITLDTLSLTKKHNSIQLKFVLPNPFKPDSVVYAYRLLGYENNWQIGKKRVVDYNDLSGGTYKFEMKAKEIGKDWTEANSLTIEIDKYFYQTLGFWLILIFSLPLLFFFTRWLLSREQRLAFQNAFKSLIQPSKKEPYQIDVETLVAELNSPKENKIPLLTSEGVEFFFPKDIVRCEAESNYTTIFLADGNKLLLSKTLKLVEKQMPNSFLRVHSSHLVNIIFIKKYVKGDGGYLILEDGSNIPVSRSRRSVLLDLWKE